LKKILGLSVALFIFTLGFSKATYDTTFVTKDSMFHYRQCFEKTSINWGGNYFYLFGRGPWKKKNTKIDGYTFSSNSKEGKWRYYFISGKLHKTGSFKGDKEEGEWIEYFENGKVFQKKNFKAGYEDGMRETYNELGELLEKKNYRVGVFYEKTLRTEYDERGIKISEHQLNSKREFDGKYTGWYPNGVVKETGFYAKGKEVGEWLEYHESGKLLLKSSFTKADEITITVYYPSGEKQMEALYRAKGGQVEGHGKFSKYYRSGNVELIGNYQEGLEDGEWQYYDLDGKIIKTEIYQKGNLIEKKF
jgi:uncharacterized protein